MKRKLFLCTAMLIFFFSNITFAKNQKKQTHLIFTKHQLDVFSKLSQNSIIRSRANLQIILTSLIDDIEDIKYSYPQVEAKKLVLDAIHNAIISHIPVKKMPKAIQVKVERSLFDLKKSLRSLYKNHSVDDILNELHKLKKELCTGSYWTPVLVSNSIIKNFCTKDHIDQNGTTHFKCVGSSLFAYLITLPTDIFITFPTMAMLKIFLGEHVV